MGVAHKLSSYLDQNGIEPELLAHRRTATAAQTAHASHLPAERIAKAVLLRDGGGYLLAVLPASQHLALDAVERLCGRPVSLASEEEVGRLFPDCELGSVPPVGAAYGLPGLVDDTLRDQPDIYLEAGDHQHLLHVSGAEFAGLMRGVRHGRLGVPGQAAAI
ncbi:MAG: aminoacyl-tRNA deacylase [Geminicoccaceae bacterium]